MRELKYLSPTAISDWGEDGDIVKRSEFYLKRLAENRPPRLAQTLAMSVGSAFDAYVKSYLYEKLYGNYGKEVDHRIVDQNNKETIIRGPEFDLHMLFNVQVEPLNRKQAFIDGQHCLNMYRGCGALSDLLIEMQMAQGDVRFEIQVEANISHECMVCNVPLLGKPDLSFKTMNDILVVDDWKVNGFYSKAMKSPAKGYIKCRDAWDSSIAPPSRGGAVVTHKDCMMKQIGGIWINSMLPFEQINLNFARQLTIYGWVLGSLVGADFIIGIEQLCGKPHPNGVLLRVASHRGMVSQKYQFELALEISKIWQSILDEHIFNWMSKDESQSKCAVLDEYHNMYKDEDDMDERERLLAKWFQENTRPARNF